MADITLAAEPRSERGSRPAGRLRRQGLVPAVIYGLGTDTRSVVVPSRELAHILAGESGANTLITLQVDGESILTLARQIQRHPTRGDLVHVDFIRIRRDVAVTAEIPVHLTGEAVGVRDGGLLEQQLFSLSVEAMPGNIPVAIEYDVSELAIGDHVRIADLRLPAGVDVHHDTEELVAHVVAPRVAVEVEEAAEEEAAAGEEAPEAGAAGAAEGEGAGE
jgi:large subunit ribosomal protein L25